VLDAILRNTIYDYLCGVKKETIALILFILAFLLFMFGCAPQKVIYTTDFKYELDPLHEKIKCCIEQDCWDSIK